MNSSQVALVVPSSRTAEWPVPLCSRRLQGLQVPHLCEQVNKDSYVNSMLAIWRDLGSNLVLQYARVEIELYD
jgi:hypothetical protein